MRALAELVAQSGKPGSCSKSMGGGGGGVLDVTLDED